MKKLLFILIFCFTSSIFADETLVKISKDLPYFYTYHQGKKIKVARIQDPQNRLNDDYTKTSRECPPFCIHPMRVNDKVETIGELEFIKYMQDKDALIVDARLKSWYELETIPSAINIPYNIFENSDQKKIDSLLKLLGKSNGDFKNAKTLVLFCNGIWCDQSPRLIRSLLKYGYPPSKLKYYRNGFQGWKIFGLTTVVLKENKR